VLLLPVELLAVGRTIERLLARTAHLVLPDVALGSPAEVALLHKSHILLALLSCLDLEL